MFGKPDPNTPPKLNKKEMKELEKQRKQEEKTAAALARYGLDSLTNPKDIESVKKIISSQAGDGFFEFGQLLGGANEKDYLRQIYYQNQVLVEQNFILIRQLDEIASKMK